MCEISYCSKSSARFNLTSGNRLSDLLGYWHIKFILSHLEHFGLSSSHYIPILDKYYHTLLPYVMRTLILRALHFSQPYRDFVCDLRVFIFVPLSFWCGLSISENEMVSEGNWNNGHPAGSYKEEYIEARF